MVGLGLFLSRGTLLTQCRLQGVAAGIYDTAPESPLPPSPRRALARPVGDLYRLLHRVTLCPSPIAGLAKTVEDPDGRIRA